MQPQIKCLRRRSASNQVAGSHSYGSSKGTPALSRPGWPPEEKWWQAMLKPGYEKLVLISQHSPSC